MKKLLLIGTIITSTASGMEPNSRATLVREHTLIPTVGIAHVRQMLNPNAAHIKRLRAQCSGYDYDTMSPQQRYDLLREIAPQKAYLMRLAMHIATSMGIRTEQKV